MSGTNQNELRRLRPNQAANPDCAAAVPSVTGAELQRLTFSVPEAGKILGISRGAAYSHAKTGTIPVIRLGKRLLVPRASLEKLLKSPDEGVSRSRET